MDKFNMEPEVFHFNFCGLARALALVTTAHALPNQAFVPFSEISHG
jgi:hypothetical protein